MASNLPPIRSPMYINGAMTQPWSTFFTRLLIQSGSTSTSSGVDDLTPINFTDSLVIDNSIDPQLNNDQVDHKISYLEGIILGLVNQNYELEKRLDDLSVAPQLGFTPVNVLGDKMHGLLGLNGYTVATLPAGRQGDTAYVTDATAPTYLATLTGSGAVVCPVFYDGTNWVST